jgi:glutamate racemase
LKPIGVFDSGVGGLTVAASLRRRLPGESILYLGDTARLPYGTKSPETVTRYTERNLRFFAERGVKAVVVACNTASALALPNLKPSLPTWGVIGPGAEKALELSRNRRIGVIATESTIRSDAYGEALRRRCPEVEVESRACPLFVPLVEEGWLDDPIAEAIAERYLAPLRAAQVDTVVLGCTHYPLLKSVIQRTLGADVSLVDSAEAVAEAVAQGLEAAGLLEDSPRPGIRVCCTDIGAPFLRTIQRVLGPEATLPELVDV